MASYLPPKSDNAVSGRDGAPRFFPSALKPAAVSVTHYIRNIIGQIFSVIVDHFLAQSPSMTSKDNNWLPALGFLRIALLGLALLNILLPLIGIAFPLATDGHERHMWTILTSVIAPVLAPLFIVVILVDYIMSLVRAADADGELRAVFVTIGRIELAAIGISLLFWVPYFVFKLN
jgi:hypothetical protein